MGASEKKLLEVFIVDVDVDEDLTQPYRRNNEEQWLESTNLDLQEGLGFESTELTSSILESTRGVLESTSTEHSLKGRTLKRRKQSSQKG